MVNTTRCRGAWFWLLTIMLAMAATGCEGTEARKAKHVERGQQFMAERNYSKARLEFRNALQIDPKDAEVRALAGLAAENLGNYDEATKMYRVALSGDETLTMPRANLARMMALGGLAEEALATLAPGLEKAPRSAELLSVRALVHAQLGDPVLARKDARDAVAVDPKNAGAVSTLVAIMWQAGERAEAVDIARSAVAGDPQNIDLRVLLGQLLVESDRLSDAEGEFAEVVRLDPANVGYAYQLARIYLLQDKPNEAVATLRNAVEAVPFDREAKLALLQIVAASGSFEDAQNEIGDLRSGAPRDFQLHLGIAQFYETIGRQVEAEQAYAAIVEEANGTPWAFAARSSLARLKVRSGQTEEASQLISVVLADNPSDADALAVRAEIALQNGDAAAAISDLRVAFGNQPDSVALAVALSHAHVQAGQPELAEQVLRSVVQTSPGDPQARFALARLLTQIGKQTQARPVLEQLIAAQPNNLLAIEELARLQASTDDLEGARKSAASLQTLLPNSARGYLLAGYVEQTGRHAEEARKLYEQAATVDPKSPEPVIALIRLDLAENQPQRALDRLDGALARMPASAILLSVRGDVLMGIERPDAAVESYAAAIQLRPDWPQPYRSLARAELAGGKQKEAVAALEKGMTATGGSPWIALDLARLHARIGNINAAVEIYEGMLARDWREDSAANNLALLLVNHRTDPASLQRASRLVERFKNSDVPGFLDTYGWVKWKLGEYSEAVPALERAVRGAPKSQEMRYHLGMAQLSAGNLSEARKHLEIAVAGNPSYIGLDEARATLAKL